MPSGDELSSWYKRLSYQIVREYFDNAYMKEEFLTKYDQDYNPDNTRDDVRLEISDSNISLDEVESAIISLRNNKSTGTYYIPAEFVKYNEDILARDIWNLSIGL